MRENLKKKPHPKFMPCLVENVSIIPKNALINIKGVRKGDNNNETKAHCVDKHLGSAQLS